MTFVGAAKYAWQDTSHQQYLTVFLPKPMRYPLALNGLKALEIQDALCVFVTSRVPFLSCFHVCHASFQYALHQQCLVGGT